MYIDVLFLEVQVLLLTDVLVLMEKSEDKDKYKYHLRCHTLIDAIKEKEEVRKCLHSFTLSVIKLYA